MARARIRETTSQGSGPPVTFRPGPDLEQLVRPFVERHRLSHAVAFKSLAALALVGLDQRHYPLVAQLAAAIVGDNPFTRACVYLQGSFAGASALRSGLVVEEEPRRSQLVFDVVRAYLAAHGGEVKTEGLWFTPVLTPAAAPAEPDPNPGRGADVPAPAESVATAGPKGSKFGEPTKRRILQKKRG